MNPVAFSNHNLKKEYNIENNIGHMYVQNSSHAEFMNHTVGLDADNHAVMFECVSCRKSNLIPGWSWSRWKLEQMEERGCVKNRQERQNE